ncbi:MAG: hypothetical protein LBR61_07735 [Synergistaceae bacterium]|nr:hypothetical protein [Synergistaceae bacterium]
MGAKEIYWIPAQFLLPDGTFEIVVDSRMSLEERRKIEKEIFDCSGKPFRLNGEPCLLYIPEVSSAEEPSSWPKFHFMECQTIKSMRGQGRFDTRYVVTNSATGHFRVKIRRGSGKLEGYVFINHTTDKYRTSVRSDQYASSGEVQTLKLHVCKHCLSEYNYRGYRRFSPREQEFAVENFDLKGFFADGREQNLIVRKPPRNETDLS